MLPQNILDYQEKRKKISFATKLAVDGSELEILVNSITEL